MKATSIAFEPSPAVGAWLSAVTSGSVWDRLRRLAVGSSFRRSFHRLNDDLCEPGGLPAHGIHRVLICRPNHRLGNAVLLSPLIRQVELLYPGAEIDILASEVASTLFANRFRVGKVFAVPRRVARHLPGTCSLLRELRRQRYDLAIDACHGSQSGRLALGMARARYKLGCPDAEAYPDSAWRMLDAPVHHALRSVYLLRAAYSGRRPDTPFPALDIGLSQDEKLQAAPVLASLCPQSDRRNVAVLGIFTNATGRKRYDEAWWAIFLETFGQRCPEVQIVDLVAAHGTSQVGGRFVPFYTQNLRRLGSLIANMQGFISADCGVMHLAAASGTPTLGLFNTTDPAKYAPYGPGNEALDTHALAPGEVAMRAARWFRRVQSDHAGGIGSAATENRSASDTLRAST